VNAKRAKQLRKAARDFIAKNPKEVKDEGHIQVIATKVVMCNPRGPRSIYKAVKRLNKGRGQNG
jgi:hypothetical protein